MTLTISKPTVGGSLDTWGTTINTALDDIAVAVNGNIFPTGGIIMWSGSVASIPSGWNICDGTNSTPDLRNRFVVGAGDTYSPDDTGGADDVTLTEAQMPSHTHSFSGSTGTAGDHSHSINDPQHSHYGLLFSTTDSGDNGGPATGSDSYTNTNNIENLGTTSSSTGITINNAGDHSHSVTGTNATAGSGAAHENRPPYYALAYIMKA